MDPKVNPQGTLSQLDPSNPLIAAAQGQGPAAAPTATDTAQETPNPTGSPLPGMGDNRAPMNGGATMAERFPGFQSQWNRKFTDATVQATKTGMSPLAAAVVGAIHANNPTPTPQPPPTTGQKVAGGVVKGVDALTKGLGDAAAVGTVSPGGGALQGIARTMQARGQRQQQERVVQSQIDKNSVEMAEANTRMLHEQRLVSKLDEDTKQQSVDSGMKQIQLYKSLPSPGIIKGAGLTSDQIQDLIAKGEINDPNSKQIDPTKETAIPDGLKTVGEDKDGRPITRMTYSVVKPPQSVTLDASYPGSKQIIDELNKYAPQDGGTPWREGQNFTGTQFNLLMQHAADVRAVTQAVKQSMLNNKIMDQKQAQDIEAVNLRETPDLVNALSHTTNGDIMAARSELMKLKNQDGTAKYPNLDYDLQQAIPEYDKLLKAHQDKIEQYGNTINDLSKKLDTAHGEEAAGIAANLMAKIKDPATPPEQVPQLRRLMDRATASANASADFKALEEERAAQIKKRINEQEPEASEADKALVIQIGEGRSAYPNPRTKEGQRLAALVAKAYPDYDEGKAPAWFDARKRFTSGKTGDALNSSNTVLEHLQRAFEHTTTSAILNPLSEDHQRLATDKTFITGELGKAVKGGVISVDESHQILDALSGGVTVKNRKDRLKEASTLLMDKISNYQQQFQDAAPSHYIVVPTLLKPAAKASYDYIQSDGQVGKSITQVQQQQNQQQKSVVQLPPAAVQQLKQGQVTTFNNGQSWTLGADGKPVQVTKPQGQ